ncbi:MAG: hypothetical protein FWD59_09495 [Micrococcales bacterium]|nr:hypothetical protein [Micrococcales bacterium]
MTKLTAAERAELEAYGAALADQIEADDSPPTNMYDMKDLPPELALQHAAILRSIALGEADAKVQDAVQSAREAGLSWHKIALPLHLTAEGARKKFAHV